MELSVLKACTQELLKLAEVLAEEPQEPGLTPGKKALLASGVATGALVGNTGAGVYSMLKNTEDPGGRLRQALESEARQKGVHRVHTGDASFIEGDPSGSFWNKARASAGGRRVPIEKDIITGARNMDPAFLAHEMGHRDIHHNPLGRILQNRATTIGGMASPLLGLATGFGTGIASDDEDTKRLGVAAPALAAAPMLGYEGLASIQGLRKLRAAGATPAQLTQAGKKLLMAHGTYGTVAALGVGGALGAQAAGDKVRRVYKNYRDDEPLTR